VEYPITYLRKIRFSDSDAQGIVFNANYLTYIDDAISDYFEALEVGWAEMNERGYDLVLRRAELDYRSSARIGDTLVTGVRVGAIGTSSVTFDVSIWDEHSGRVAVQGREVQVMIDHDGSTKRAVPSWFVEAVENLQGSPVEWTGRT
jgi:acyl-CoA thioester hydrolase